MRIEAAPREFRPFLEGLRQRTVRFPRCRNCDRFHWYPMKRCPHCQSAEIDWQEATGPVTLYTWTTYRRAFAPEFRDDLPYTIGVVEFSGVPGVRLVTRIVGGDPDGLAIGDRLRPVFPAAGEDPPLVHFAPADGIGDAAWTR